MNFEYKILIIDDDGGVITREIFNAMVDDLEDGAEDIARDIAHEYAEELMIEYDGFDYEVELRNAG